MVTKTQVWNTEPPFSYFLRHFQDFFFWKAFWHNDFVLSSLKIQKNHQSPKAIFFLTLFRKSTKNVCAFEFFSSAYIHQKWLTCCSYPIEHQWSILYPIKTRENLFEYFHEAWEKLRIMRSVNHKTYIMKLRTSQMSLNTVSYVG